MDEHRFDAMTKALGRGLIRRRVLGGITGSAFAGLLGSISPALAKPKEHCAKAGQKPKDTKKGCCPGLAEGPDGRCAEVAGFACPPGAGTSMCGQTPVFCTGPAPPNSCAAYQTTEGACACASGGPGPGRLPCVDDTVCMGQATCLPGDPVTGGPEGGHCGGASAYPCVVANNDPTTGVNPDCAFLATCSEGFCGGQACLTSADCQGRGQGDVCVSAAAFCPAGFPHTSGNFCKRFCSSV
jgi:hypothetical protein